MKSHAENERPVLLWQSAQDDHDGPLDLHTIRQFKPAGERDDRLTISVPNYTRRALESLVNDVGRTNINSVSQFALVRGLERFETWPEIAAICDARAVLLQRGSPDLTQIDQWPYQTAARDGTSRSFLRSVEPASAGRCSGRARGLGLATSTYGALSVMAGIVDADLAGDLPRLLLSELREFRRGLRQRAVLAVELHKRAVLLPVIEPVRVSWREVIDDD